MAKMRSFAHRRTTKESDVVVRLNLDGHGSAKVKTGIRFLDHMLELVARHGGMDLALTAQGDLDVDQHHTVEDVGITLGEAVKTALGNKRGILRAGFAMPMDESLAVVAVDFGGRGACVCRWKFTSRLVGDLQTELLEDFFQGFAQAAGANVHVDLRYGRATHHQVEAVFKAFGRAIRFAVTRDKQLRKVLPSTKGLL